MASVEIIVHTGGTRYVVEMEQAETFGEAWGDDKKYLDDFVDAAVARIKRAYTPPEVSETSTTTRTTTKE